MDFPSREPLDEPAPERIMSTENRSESNASANSNSFDDRSFDDRSFVSDAGPAALAYSSHASPSIQLDPAHATVANFERDDLDVPAFLRKRSEVM
jgi:hypothetical protein